MQFVTRSRHFACVLGARSLAELDDSLAMANLPLPGELWDELVHRGLIDDAWLPARHEGAIW